MDESISTFNAFMATVSGDRVVIMRPKSVLHPNEALLLAAYLVLLAEHKADHTFAEVLGAVQNT